MLKLSITAAVAAFFVASSASAATINIVNQPDPNQTVVSIDEFTVFGKDMAGTLRVTAGFAGGSTESVLWAAGVGDAGVANGTGFSLSLPGDSFTKTWTLTNNSQNTITSLLLEGYNDGNGKVTIFDKTLPRFGTEGSRSGRTFEEAPSLGAEGNGTGTVTVTYLNAVTLPGDPPVGDVFKALLVDFSEFANGGVASTFLFRQDTDLAPVPLPAAGLLLLGALGGLAALGRRKTQMA